MSAPTEPCFMYPVETMGRLLQDEKLSNIAVNIIYTLIGYMMSKNSSLMSKEDIITTLGRHPSTVSHALNYLIKKKVIFEHIVDGAFFYQLNEIYGCRVMEGPKIPAEVSPTP